VLIDNLSLGNVNNRFNAMLDGTCDWTISDVIKLLNIDIAYCILDEVASCDLYVLNIILRVIIVQSRYIVDALIVVCVCGVCVIELCRRMTLYY